MDPDKYFTRHRKLSFETLCKTILAMGGQSLNAELQQQFHFDTTAATTSAFVQQRSKILPSAFEAIFHDFTYADCSLQKWNGYRLLAVDGSRVQIATNTDDKKTYLLFCEDRKTYQCYPSYKTIGDAVGLSFNTVRKYVARLEERKLITTEPTIVSSEDGQPRNGTLLYTVRPIQEALNYDQECRLLKFDATLERQETEKILKQYEQESEDGDSA